MKKKQPVSQKNSLQCNEFVCNLTRGSSRSVRVIKALIIGVAFIISTCSNVPGYAQSIRWISAISGSYAPWGSNQFLTIDSAGNASVSIKDVNTGQGISSMITLNNAQLQALMDTVSSANFFALDTLYNSRYVDGSFIYLNIITTNNQHAVEVINACITPVNRVVKAINALIVTSKIQLQYGELNQVCP